MAQPPAGHTADGMADPDHLIQLGDGDGREMCSWQFLILQMLLEERISPSQTMNFREGKEIESQADT